jgi:hypothetical protein
MSTTDVCCSQEVSQERIHEIPQSYDVTSRHELLVVVSVLLKYLAKKDPSLRARTAKVRCLMFLDDRFRRTLKRDLIIVSPSLSFRPTKIVQECVVRNRIGQSEYTPLVPVVSSHLKELIGEKRFNKAVQKARERQVAQQTVAGISFAPPACLSSQVAEV